MSAHTANTNFAVYCRTDVASHYAALNYLTACEQLLFQRHIEPGMSILDLGVGGGRTSYYLSQIASQYVGVDYSAEMIAACRRRFAHLQFRQADASDLSCFADASFDSIVMAFNGMDMLSSSARQRCLAECKRLLRPAGVLIFSGHNPRAILVRPSYNQARIERLSRGVNRNRVLQALVFATLTCAAAVKATFTAAVLSLSRAATRLPNRAFWSGEGYIIDPAHGGLLTHYAVPACVMAELQEAGFQVREVRGDDYPQRSGMYITDWFYYVCSKARCGSVAGAPQLGSISA